MQLSAFPFAFPFPLTTAPRPHDRQQKLERQRKIPNQEKRSSTPREQRHNVRRTVDSSGTGGGN